MSGSHKWSLSPTHTYHYYKQNISAHLQVLKILTTHRVYFFSFYFINTARMLFI